MDINEIIKAFGIKRLNKLQEISIPKIIEGRKGLFVAMPSRKMQNGKFQDLAHPIVTETREKIQEQVLDKYKKELENLNL